jgi:hypothetical protein
VTQAELDKLVGRANDAGYNTIPEHYAECLGALIWIAGNDSGVWGVRARETLGWGRGVDRASRAVAQRGQMRIDDALTDALHRDGT